MISHIIKDTSMGDDFETQWQSFTLEHPNEKLSAVGLQIVWQNAIGELTGTIKLLATIVPSAETVIQTVAVNSASNLTNSVLIELNPVYTYLKLRFTANGITNGLLNAYLLYN